MFKTLETKELTTVLDKTLLAAISQLMANVTDTDIAVACSGGVDSAMLALHAAVWARQQKKNLHFFHVHHGLQQPAEGWVLQVQELAMRLGVAVHVQRVQVDLSVGDGLESAARTARYHAFKQMASLTQLRHVLVGHHLDDQAETVLLRLLRGAGVTGMGAMAASTQRDGLTYLRPWLGQPRTKLLAAAQRFAQLSGWQPVLDPTNLQDEYTRGALRDRLVPHLNERWQGWQQVVARHAQQSQEAAALLDEVAAADLATLAVDPISFSFDLRLWRELSAARQSLVLRYWLAQQQQAMPSQARLADMLRQLRTLHALGFDRQMRIKHGQVFLCCAKGRVFLQFEMDNFTVK